MNEGLILRKNSVLLLACGLAALLALLPVMGAHAQSPRPSLDSALTRQTYALGPAVERAEWAGFSAALQFRSKPVWFGIGSGYVSLRDRLLHCPINLNTGERHPLSGNHWLRYGGKRRWRANSGLLQLNNYMDDLDLERRQSEYERLSRVLRERASKINKLEKALPVLIFALDEQGTVVGVTVDGSRTKTGLTSRSRNLMLKALRGERFRLPASQYTVTTKATHYQPVVRHALKEPRRLEEKLQRLSLGYRARQLGKGLVWAARPVAFPVRVLLYRKATLRGRCGETHTEWVPRFGQRS